jgi:hypothetical protein
MFLHVPVDSVLNLNVTTTFSTAMVKLHRMDEGRFNLMMSWNKPLIMVNDRVDDLKYEKENC